MDDLHFARVSCVGQGAEHFGVNATLVGLEANPEDGSSDDLRGEVAHIKFAVRFARLGLNITLPRQEERFLVLVGLFLL